MDKPPCFECDRESHHMHHVVPRSLGGTKMVPLCEACHGLVHGLDMSGNGGHARLTRKGLEKARAEGRIGGRRPKYPQGIRDKAISMREDGGSCRVIARALSISPSLVSQIVRSELGLPRPGRHKKNPLTPKPTGVD